MRVLITWSSKHGGTEGIGRALGDALRAEGLDVELVRAEDAPSLERFDAVVVGGALYANRWRAPAHRFVTHHIAQLRRIPVWFFSSGPLDDSAERTDIAPTNEVSVLMERVGAQGHVTFGGRLAADAKGFPASAMAKARSGDWRNESQIRAWAHELAAALPTARPRPFVDPPARSFARLFAHALAGWAPCALALGALSLVTSAGVAVALDIALTPIVFALVARHYFTARGSRDPLPTALSFTAVAAILDVAIVPHLVRTPELTPGNVAGLVVHLLFVSLSTWATGAVCATLPWRRPGEAPSASHPAE
jgi:menaquinone-dependent protoporphyrinogen oxidase